MWQLRAEADTEPSDEAGAAGRRRGVGVTTRCTRPPGRQGGGGSRRVPGAAPLLPVHPRMLMVVLPPTTPAQVELDKARRADRLERDPDYDAQQGVQRDFVSARRLPLACRGASACAAGAAPLLPSPLGVGRPAWDARTLPCCHALAG